MPYIITAIIVSIGFLGVLASPTTVQSPREPIVYPVQLREPVRSIKWVEATVTAYTSEIGQTDDSPCISANGSNICELFLDGQNTCAANFVKFGTEITIPGVGVCTVRDRMNSRFDDTFHIDYYMGYDTKRAKLFGVQTIKITF